MLGLYDGRLNVPFAELRSLRDLAVSCQQGDAAASRESLRLAESALGRAAVELETYGLSP